MGVRSVATDIRVIFNWLAEEPNFHWTLREMLHTWSDGRIEKGQPRPLNRVARAIERVTTAGAVGAAVWGLAAEGIVSAFAGPMLFLGAGWLLGGTATMLVEAMEEKAKRFETWAIEREYKKTHKNEIRQQKDQQKERDKLDKQAWDNAFKHGSFYQRMAMRFHKWNQPFEHRWTLTTGIKKLLLMDTPEEVRSKFSRVVERVMLAGATYGAFALLAGPSVTWPFLLAGAWIIGEGSGRIAQRVGEFAEGFFTRQERLRVEKIKNKDKPKGPVTTPYSVPDGNDGPKGDTLDANAQVITYPDGKQQVIGPKLSAKFWEEAADSRNMGEIPPVQGNTNTPKPPANSR